MTNIDELQLLSIAEAGRILRLGKTALYGMARAGELRILKIGGAARIPSTEIARLVGTAQPRKFRPLAAPGDGPKLIFYPASGRWSLEG